MKRTLYQELITWKISPARKPLLLRGARQVGKTWLIKEFGKAEFGRIHSFNFQENPALASIFDSSLNPVKIIKMLELSTDVKISIEKDLIFFDEIQECPKAITSLKYFYENMPKAAVCCAGSHIGVSMLESSFPVGKIHTLTLYPINFNEFLLNNYPDLFELKKTPAQLPEIMHHKMTELLKIYYAVGGMPEPNNLYLDRKELDNKCFAGIREIQKQILTGYQSDFAKYSGKVNANHINRVFENIPLQIIKNTDFSVGRFRFKDVIPGYSKYSQIIGPIEWLIKAGLCYPVHVIESPDIPLAANRKENIFKLMFIDTGLLNCMVNLPLKSILQQDFGNYKGYLAENFAAQELVSYGIQGLYSWTGRTSEIEFLLQKNGAVIPLEVKSGRRSFRTKSLDVYVSKYSPSESIIASMNPYRTSGKKTYLPLYWLSLVLPEAQD